MIVLSLPPIPMATTTTTLHQSSSPLLLPTTTQKPKNSSLQTCKTLIELKQLHCNMLKKGVFNINKLIAACVQMGTHESLNYALNAFKEDEGTKCSLYTCNTLIRGYAASGLCKEAIFIYLHMIIVMGIVPDNFTFPFLLSACSKIMAFSEGVQVHGVVVKMGLVKDLFVANSLIHFYAACGKVDLGRKVFDEMLERNVVSWTSLINGYSVVNMAKEAVCLFFEMVEVGVEPNPVTMVCAISACAKLKDLELGKKVCNLMTELGVKSNTLVVNALLDMYMKCGDMYAVREIFDEFSDKNLVMYNTIMSNYVQHGLAGEVLVVLDEMLQKGQRPDKVTMLSTIAACAQLGDLSVGKSSHAYVFRNGLERLDNISNAIIDMYMKCGKREAACKVFDSMSNKTVVTWNSLIAGLVRDGELELALRIFGEMPESNLVSWNTMIGAMVQASMFEEAIDLLREMQNQGIKGDRVTMVGIASACGYLGALDLAKWIYTYIEKNDIHIDMQLGTALVDMFSRCGDPLNAMRVFENMEKRDVSAWTAAIRVKAVEGNAKGAIELFDEMLKQDVKADDFVFVALLTAFSHGGYVDQGRQLFWAMEKIHGVSPQIVHYGCMVDLLGRAGLLEEAFDLMKSMPIKPNDVIWGSFLAACRKHKNVEFANYADEKITQLAPEKVGIHVLLSNIYASAGKWNDVARVRLQMKEKGFQKVAGSSSIEVHGLIREFTSGDESHTENAQIGLMLQEINCRISQVGYVPDTTNVLVDVDEQEKEHLLSRHSEKLAMAYGLINTGKGIPIRVVKNLRMCSDCHSFAKLVSKLYGREITVRDNNRYHFFKEGFCSCRDFW
ncbi:putative tetratricopeptide-like helical domain, DYW domain-containing protein [Medicago truncatula]|uniref:Pentatricopeptide (PPR) repeat protein n=1 Tax=Medicago truncatula TaxID=3880 RepID=G7K3Q3_MEDTR|nr:pentatricopeptide repeat-containing protein At3g22690 [Medicago truncatula]AES93706.2 pentatricopeptide (PPR) repeat protein [Medicago truncatula]RHN53328.1 putative tetratricopeptide-like helical domain, DYW domain-containing protein [Medicago truncatula]